MHLLQRVSKYIEDNNLLTDHSKTIIGVSGGADSMALLHILYTLEYDCIVAHCNFHLRGEESDRDQVFVETYCKRNNIKYECISFDTYKYMQENGISLEMAARELRYNWFEEVRKKHKADNIAIAHHQDDTVETVLINIIRGCGIRGLTGIAAKNGNVVRPLLCLNRFEINTYLESQSIAFVTDSTNNENIYVRNKIRLDIIPQLKEINPSVQQSILRMSEYLSDVEKIYDTYIKSAKEEVFDGKNINIEKLQALPQPKTILFEILHSYGFNSDTINDIYEAGNGISGKIFYSNDYRLIKDRSSYILDQKERREEELSNNYFYEINENDKLISIPIDLSIETIPNSPNLVLDKNKRVLYADKDKLSFPLCIRKWRQGDRFIPLGMSGNKKLSDYFSDNKFSIPQKENTWLLCTSEDKIIWIIGERSDNIFLVSNTTSKILKIELK